MSGRDPDGPAAIADGLIEATRRMVRLAGRLGEAGAGQPVEIVETPSTPVWADGKISLRRYRAGEAPDPALGPIVIVHGLIGRQTMLDLEPRRSFVRRMLAAGVDTYAADWGMPTRADRWRDTTDYAVDALGDMLAAIERLTGAPRAVLMGICQGGVFALAHAALFPDRVKGLVLAVTPVDFHADMAEPRIGRGQLNHWLRTLPVELIDRLIEDGGNVPGALTAAIFNGLTPGRWTARYTADLAEIADDPAALDTFLRMEKWLADRPDQPGALAREWMVDLYRENHLVRGQWRLDGRRVDLADVACPVMNVYARDDHIVPPPCTRALKGYLRNVAYRELEVPTGHVGAFVSARAQDIVAPAVVEWLAETA
ncbi:MAG: alpha/beta fold hydrolase [Pseudomonadota bacterium]